MGMALLTSIAAEFRRSIGTFFPQIVDLLKDDKWDVRATAAKALWKLSEHGM
jgi:HEAT repeat protein